MMEKKYETTFQKVTKHVTKREGPELSVQVQEEKTNISTERLRQSYTP
uniref:Uncharacterized protein n=1 Tax=Nothobranchius pienaari TaxID=704102 RepID=A0A1A8LEF4_9TELE